MSREGSSWHDGIVLRDAILLGSLCGVLGCAGPAVAPAATPSASPELSTALAPLAWWLGDWDASDGSGSEHWIAAGGALYGVSLHGASFEVLVVDDGDGPGRPDGVLRLFAMPGGKRSVEFAGRELGATSAVFANDAHDFPKTITYARSAGDGLSAVLAGDEPTLTFSFTRGKRAPAPVLEAADRAFAADTGARGVDGWVAAFAPDGGMMRPQGRVARDAIAGVMAPVLSGGRLDWAPIASGMAGELGFTVGKATFTPTGGGAGGWRSSYVTIWRKQPAGDWKVLFDTGRIVHE